MTREPKLPGRNGQTAQRALWCAYFSLRIRRGPQGPPWARWSQISFHRASLRKRKAPIENASCVRDCRSLARSHPPLQPPSCSRMLSLRQRCCSRRPLSRRKNLIESVHASRRRTSHVSPARRACRDRPCPSSPPPRRAAGQSRLVDRRVDRAQHAERRREVRAASCARAGTRGRVRVALVVDEQVRLGDAVAERHDLGLAGRSCGCPCRVPLPKTSGLPCSSTSCVSALMLLLGQVRERAVVEDVAVLQDLDERRALVRGRAPEHLPAGASRRRRPCARRRWPRRRARATSGLNGLVDRARAASTWSSCRAPRSASTGPWSGRRSGC